MSEVIKRKVYRKLEERKQNLPDIAVEYLDSLEEKHSIQTQFEYAKDLSLFFEFLLDIDRLDYKHMKFITLEDIKTFSKKDIEDFMDYLTKFKKTFYSVGGNLTTQVFTNGLKGKERKRASLYNFFQYLIEHNYIKGNPTIGIQIQTEKYTTTQYLTEEQLQRMFRVSIVNNPDAFRGLRNCLILKILSYTGIRISELVSLDINDVLEKQNMFVVTRSGGEQEYIAIPEEIRDTFYYYLEERKKVPRIKQDHKEALFISQQKRRMVPRSVRKMIRKVAGEAGIPFIVTPHTFRLTFAWIKYQETNDIELISGLLGNRTTEPARYILTNKKTQAD